MKPEGVLRMRPEEYKSYEKLRIELFNTPAHLRIIAGNVRNIDLTEEDPTKMQECYQKNQQYLLANLEFLSKAQSLLNSKFGEKIIEKHCQEEGENPCHIVSRAKKEIQRLQNLITRLQEVAMSVIYSLKEDDALERMESAVARAAAGPRLFIPYNTAQQIAERLRETDDQADIRLHPRKHPWSDLRAAEEAMDQEGDSPNTP